MKDQRPNLKRSSVLYSEHFENKVRLLVRSPVLTYIQAHTKTDSFTFLHSSKHYFLLRIPPSNFRLFSSIDSNSQGREIFYSRLWLGSKCSKDLGCPEKAEIPVNENCGQGIASLRKQNLGLESPSDLLFFARIAG